MIKNCEYCKQEYYVKNYRAEVSKYCSKECADLGRRNRTSLICQRCSKEFQTFNRYKDAKFCSVVCRDGKNLDINGYATCKDCGTAKPVEKMAKAYNSKSGVSTVCKDCKAIRTKKANLKRYYGISKLDYDKMCEKQNHRCLICQEKPKKLYVDHCHQSGQVRGLLCQQCNSAIGLLKDNTENLKRAIVYLS